MNNIYYFDNSATTKTDKEVINEMIPYYAESYGNPSSIYKIGRENRKAIEDARDIIASALNCDEKEIYFTCGGSESDNTAIRGIAYSYKDKGNHIITSKIEHFAVLETCKQLEKEGFDTDAVQAVGNIKIDVKELGIDALSMSGHKFYGPKGIGALYVSKKVKFQKFMQGGHQERNKRAGTENVPGIVGMGKAIEIAYKDIEEHNRKISELRDYYEKQIKERIPYIKINGAIDNRLPGNSNISFRFIEGEGILLNLDAKGICASSGSACTSGSLDPSHVLLAIGLPHEIAHGSLRVSIGKYNTKEEIDYLVENLVEIVNRLRDMSPLWEEFIEGGK